MPPVEPPEVASEAKTAYSAPPQYRRVMAIFLNISSKRPAGMGVSAIPSAEIEAYARRHHLELSIFEHEVLDRIDRAFMNGVNKALKTDRQSDEKKRALVKGGASNGRKRK